MIRPICKIHGGKSYLKQFVIEHFPKDYVDMRYIEPCGGAASVLLNKLRSREEIYCDLDVGLHNLVYCLNTQPEEMCARAQATTYTQETFDNARLGGGDKNAIDRAIDELIKRRMSRGGLMTHFSWSERKRGGKPGDQNAWETFVNDQLPQICKRLENVEVLNVNVLDFFKEMDSEDAFWYIDPPYLPSTRTVAKAYNVEMVEADHLKLAALATEAKGKVLISGYYSPLYLKLYKGWKLFVKEIANHSSQSKNKERRLECLWANY